MTIKLLLTTQKKITYSDRFLSVKSQIKRKWEMKIQRHVHSQKCECGKQLGKVLGAFHGFIAMLTKYCKSG